MSATILDGKSTAKAIRSEIDSDVIDFKTANEVIPTIAVVRAGEDPGSVWYANAIKKTMAGRGMEARLHGCMIV